ncbi:MAG TPA: YdiU family protein [Chromatiaceae bacterium]|jgi:uncharacterized protein YdiU (UPF0061 family)|nr:YdiU family protein [Chromatiaceae bacterium]HIB84668.1 YdiU family protein [Chromatiaceae bacterium]HIO14007.1 YdiU family protein [Chromatiales bacterium]
MKLQSLQFDNRFAALSDIYYSRVRPTPLQAPVLTSFSRSAAELIDLDVDALRSAEFVAFINGDEDCAGADPLAMLYAGHQFGHYVQQLGDGRAILLAQVRNQRGESWDLQVKGGGKTPYSRDGDGRAVLRSTIREYLCSEAMHALGIPTTRALCVFSSPEDVYRERIETGALLVRMAPSHVRFGSFEVFYYRQQYEQLAPLADHVIDEHFPELVGNDDRYLRWLERVIDLTASLIAQWQAVGFAHGVMNTDNMSVLGLTLDYGPFGFLDQYDPEFICNHSDYQGRYAFAKQPSVALWNLSCFAQSILPLLSPEPEAAGEMALALLKTYQSRYDQYRDQQMANKLGLRTSETDDPELGRRLLLLMAKDQVDYTISFRSLSSFSPGSESDLRDQFRDRDAFDDWAKVYGARLQRENSDDHERRQAMDAVNPAIVLRNYLAQTAIAQAEAGDFSEVDHLMRALSRPYDNDADVLAYAGHPPDWADQISVSCSS